MTNRSEPDDPNDDRHADQKLPPVTSADQSQSTEELSNGSHDVQYALDFLNQVRQDIQALDERQLETMQSVNSRDTPQAFDVLSSSEFESPAAPLVIGRFKILETIGEGGFSHVFRAVDPLLERDVAIKVPKPNFLVSEEDHRRFAREAHATALLNHPAIIPVFETGKSGIFSYIVSPFCQGVDLRRWLNQFRSTMTPRLAAELVARVADAAHHAHQRDIIHRDLKPENILIADGDSSVASRLRITDFGLAKFTSRNDPKLTQTAAIVGTPLYMSPEQASGSAEISSGADIFSIGVILFELLTHQLPFKKDSSLATLRAIECDPAPRLRKINPAIPPDLEAICLKCLEKNPSDRFDSAFDLAEELRRWLENRPILTRQISPIEHLHRWYRRNPSFAAVTAVAILSMLVGLSTTTWQWRHAVANEYTAKQSAQAAIDANFAANQAAKEARLSRDAAITEKQRAEAAREESERFSDFFVERVMVASKPIGFDGGQGKDVTVREMLASMESSLKQLEKYPRVEAKVRNAFGGVWREMGEYQKAAEHFLKALQLTGSDLQDRQSLISTLQMGSVLYANGKIAIAIELLESTYPSVVEVLGPHDPLSIGYLNNLGTMLTQDGHHQQAAKYFNQVLEIYLEKFGPQHIGTQVVSNNLAVTYRFAGDNQKAIELLQPVLELQINSLGEKNYQTMRTMFELAEALSQTGQTEAAKNYLNQAVATGIELLGPVHPKTIEARLYQARNMQRMGQVDAAIEACNDVIDLAIEEFGDDHAVANQARFMLIKILSSANRFEQSVAIITKTIDRHQTNGNLENAYRLIPRLAEARLKLGQSDEIENLIGQYQQPMIETLGSQAAAVINLNEIYALSLTINRRWLAAANIYQQLIATHTTSADQNSSLRRSKTSLPRWHAVYAHCLIELDKDLEKAQQSARLCKMSRVDLANQHNQAQLSEGQIAESLEAESLAVFFEMDALKAEDAVQELERIHQQLAELVTAYPFFENRQMLLRSKRRLDKIKSRLKTKN